MKKKLYLHIGAPKTGTSVLQYFFTLNAQLLLEQYNIDYPLDNMTEKFDRVKNYIPTTGNAEELLKIDFNNYKFKTDILFFSSELLLKNLTDTHLQKIINTNMLEIKFFIYSRNPIDLLISSWSQNIKRGLKMNFEEFVTNKKIEQYENLISRLKYLRENNITYCFRNYSFHKKDLIAIFFSDLIDNNFNSSRLIKPNLNKINRSHDRFETEFLINLSRKGYDKNKIHIISDIFLKNADIDSYSPFIDKKLYNFIKDKYINEIDKLNNFLLNSEKIIFEDYDSLNNINQDLNNTQDFDINFKQIESLSEYLIDFDLKIQDDEIHFLRDLAINFHNKKNSNALKLISIAKKLKPQGPLINKLFNDYLKIYSIDENL